VNFSGKIANFCLRFLRENQPKFDDFKQTFFRIWRVAKECNFCTYRKMLKNAPTPAIRRVDIAENEPSKVWSAKSIICSWHTYPKKPMYRQDAPVPAGQHNPHGPGRSRAKLEMFEKCLLCKLRVWLPERPSTRTLYEP